MVFNVTDEMMETAHAILTGRARIVEELSPEMQAAMMARCAESDADDAARQDAVRLLKQQNVPDYEIAVALESSGKVADGMEYITAVMDPSAAVTLKPPGSFEMGDFSIDAMKEVGFSVEEIHNLKDRIV